jgi:hypothetical protein
MANVGTASFVFVADGGAGFGGSNSAVQDMAKKGRIDLPGAIAFRHQVSGYTSGSSTSGRRVGGLRRGKRSVIPFLAAGSGSLLGVVFRCAPPRAPRFRGLVKSLLGQRGCRCATAQRARGADENMRKYEKTVSLKGKGTKKERRVYAPSPASFFLRLVIVSMTPLS